jgi:hypothetical protein
VTQSRLEKCTHIPFLLQQCLGVDMGSWCPFSPEPGAHRANVSCPQMGTGLPSQMPSTQPQPIQRHTVIRINVSCHKPLRFRVVCCTALVVTITDTELKTQTQYTTRSTTSQSKVPSCCLLKGTLQLVVYEKVGLPLIVP